MYIYIWDLTFTFSSCLGDWCAKEIYPAASTPLEKVGHMIAFRFVLTFAPSEQVIKKRAELP
jgi:hypothetical protein